MTLPEEWWNKLSRDERISEMQKMFPFPFIPENVKRNDIFKMYNLNLKR